MRSSKSSQEVHPEAHQKFAPKFAKESAQKFAKKFTNEFTRSSRALLESWGPPGVLGPSWDSGGLRKGRPYEVRPRIRGASGKDGPPERTALQQWGRPRE